MKTLFDILVYLSAIGFWIITGVAIYRTRKAVSGTNEKVRTREQINAVKRNVETGETVRIQ